MADFSKTTQTQIVNCKCGKTFASCYVPECYQDTDWMKDIRKYSKQGYEVKVIPLSDLKFEPCTCKEVIP